MRIEGYFQAVESLFRGHPLARSCQFTFDERGTYAGYVRGDTRFMNGSILHWREYVSVQHGFLRLMYSYQYMDSNHRLIFRYDNAGHHLHIATYPDHKHDGDEKTIVASSAPTLAEVLREVEMMMRLR